MFHQPLTPVQGSLPDSFLVAAAPIATVLVLMGVLRRPAWQASLAGLAVGLALAIGVWGFPVDLALDSLAAVQGFVHVDMCGEVELMFLTNDELTALVCSPSRLRALTDAELMDALRSGCNDALAILFERHSDWVVETARERSRNDAEIEATVGRVFADIFRAKDEFNCDRESFEHWLLKYMESDRGRSFA